MNEATVHTLVQGFIFCASCGQETCRLPETCARNLHENLTQAHHSFSHNIWPANHVAHFVSRDEQFLLPETVSVLEKSYAKFRARNLYQK